MFTTKKKLYRKEGVVNKEESESGKFYKRSIKRMHSSKQKSKQMEFRNPDKVNKRKLKKNEKEKKDI